MSPLSPAPTTGHAEGALPDLLASLQTTLHRSPDLTGCLAASQVAAAFAEDSVVRPLPAADGVWAVLRESADRSRAVLCLHNPSADPVRVRLGAVLPGRAADKLHFAGGAMHTTQEGEEHYAHLDAFGHVWLTYTP
ncbi:hypothetical protein [Actinacidiphila glaucinigra]|uniref:hypothetical protein n=1 Tax=Actinacidiphila glaucinigra TaxID=235986 RepID=UPI002E3501F0|nr:hypothetical protein [Actinacidiphila glaucinigra]